MYNERNEYRDKQKLLSDIMPWWKGNNWNPQSLEKKTVKELLAIRSRMHNDLAKRNACGKLSSAAQPNKKYNKTTATVKQSPGKPVQLNLFDME